MGTRHNMTDQLAAYQFGRRWRIGWVVGFIWLFYLAYPLREVWHHPVPAIRALGVAAIVGYGAGYVAVFALIRRRSRVGLPVRPAFAWGVVAASLALVALALPAARQEALGLLVYLAPTVMFLLPGRQAAGVVAALVAGAEVIPRIVPGWAPQHLLAFQIFVASVAGWAFNMALHRNAQLIAAQREISTLAVIEERNRLARDLHDLLGHSLTLVAIKAELAGRLVELAPQRAADEIAEVERLARRALADVRATVAGYREGSLAGELASAHAALTASGIEAEIEAEALDNIPAERQRLFSWVVREGVTNVIRHSGAKCCRIDVTTTAVEISDDGTGPAAPLDGGLIRGQGLVGLRERAEAAEARLTVGRSAQGGFALRVDG